MAGMGDMGGSGISPVVAFDAPITAAQMLDIPDTATWSFKRSSLRVLLMTILGLVGGVIAVLPMIALLITLQPLIGAVWSGVLAAALELLLLTLFICAHMWRTRRFHTRSFPPGIALTDVAARITERRAQLLDTGLSTNLLARGLHRDGHAGLVVRIARPADLVPLEPLAVPFEPMLISEDDSNFAALVPENVLTPQTRARKPHPAGRTSDEESRWHRYFIQRKGWLWLLMNAGMCLMYGLEALHKRQWGFAFPFWITLLIFSLVPMRASPGFAAQNFIVPAGLLCRRRGKLQLYRRTECVLIADAVWKTQWNALVYDGRSKARLTLTERELAVLLRAWLSPLPPPELDKLSDFAGASG